MKLNQTLFVALLLLCAGLQSSAQHNSKNRRLRLILCFAITRNMIALVMKQFRLLLRRNTRSALSHSTTQMT